MTIRYKAVKTAQPGVKGGGNYAYYPRICDRKMMSLDVLAQHISKKCTLHKADILATLTALVEEVPDLLLDNYSVQLGELGTFSLHINGSPAPSPNEVTHRKINNLKVAFRPGTAIKSELKHASFKRK